MLKWSVRLKERVWSRNACGAVKNMGEGDPFKGKAGSFTLLPNNPRTFAVICNAAELLQGKGRGRRRRRGKVRKYWEVSHEVSGLLFRREV